MASLGVGDQGTPRLGTGRRAGGRSRDRPLLHVLQPGDNPDILRGGQIAATRAFSQDPRRADHTAPVLGPWTFPMLGSERRLERPCSADRGIRGDTCEEPSSIDCAVTYPSSATSAADLIPQLSSGCAASSVVGQFPHSPSGLIEPGPMNEPKQPRRLRCWAHRFSRRSFDRAGIAAAYPELMRAAECPVLDTSCAALLRLAESVHDRGYKVVLTGEGADEALAGYVWYKAQAWADAITRRTGHRLTEAARRSCQDKCRRLPVTSLSATHRLAASPGSTCSLRDDLAREAGDLLRRA